VECSVGFSNSDLTELLNPTEYQEYDSLLIENYLENSKNVVKCPNPNCKIAHEVKVVKDKVVPENDSEGNPISIKHIKHRNKYRFRCRECQTEFCTKCKTIPYHFKFTCDEFKNYQSAVHCRFCDVQLKENNRPPQKKKNP